MNVKIVRKIIFIALDSEDNEYEIINCHFQRPGEVICNDVPGELIDIEPLPGVCVGQSALKKVFKIEE